MKKMNFKNIVLCSPRCWCDVLASCSLEEETPGGFNMENMAATRLSSYQTLLNQCYIWYGTFSCMVRMVSTT